MTECWLCVELPRRGHRAVLWRELVVGDRSVAFQSRDSPMRSAWQKDVKGNSYRVLLHGEWVVVPADTVISGPNKLGKAIVWFQKPGELAWGGDTSTPILCFIPGSEV